MSKKSDPKDQAGARGEQTAQPDDLEAVKRLLLSQERENIGGLNGRVEDLEWHLSNDPKSVSLLVEKIVLGLGHASDSTREELRLRLGALLKNDVQKEIQTAEPQVMQSIIVNFGSVIRRGIQSEFKKLIAYIDDRIGGTSSPIKRLQIRLRSLLSGRSEAELWLEAFPKFSLTSALLVQRQSGMLISSVRRERNLEDGGVLPGGRLITEGEGREEIIAGMLSTIANFASDAFNDTNAGALKTLDFESGDLKLLSSPLVQLAVLVEGPAPADLEDHIRNAFEEMLRKHHDVLVAYSGDQNAHDAAELQHDLGHILELSGAYGQDQSDGAGSPKDQQEGTIGLNGQANQSKNTGLTANPWFWVCGVLVGSLLIYFLWSGIENARRDSLIARANRAVMALEDLKSYPIRFDIQPGSDILQVYGLVSHPRQLGSINQALADALPNVERESFLRTVWDEGVAPQVDSLNVKITTNSEALRLLNDDITIQKTRIGEFEALLSDVGQSLSMVRASVPTAPVFFSDPKLVALRDRIASFLSLPGAVSTIDFDALSVDETERLVAGLTMRFGPDGELANTDTAFRAAETLSSVITGAYSGRRINLVAVVNAADTPKAGNLPENAENDRALGLVKGQQMLLRAQRILAASGIHSSDLILKIMVQPPVLHLDKAEQTQEGGLASGENFVGFSFAP